MNATELAKTFKKGSPEWRLTLKWAQYVGMQKSKLRGYQAHTYSKREASSIVFNVIAHINRGELRGYKDYLEKPIHNELTKSLLVRYWEEFCEAERLLVAEVTLTK